MTTLPNYYEVLQVSPNADEEIVQAAYRRLALRWHPDRNPGDPLASERMKLLNEAYEVLSNPLKRQEYDSRRGSSGAHRGGSEEPSHTKSKAPPNTQGGSPGAGPLESDDQTRPKEAGNSIAWALIALGTFVFVATHAFDFAIMPVAFLFGCLCWGTVFGLPVYLCFRYRKRLGAIVVAALFCLAAIRNAAYLSEQSRLVQTSPSSLRPSEEPPKRPAEPTTQQELPDSDGPIAQAAAQVPATERIATPKANPAHISPAEGSRSSAAADYFKEGLVAAKAGDYVKAIENYTEAIRIEPKRAEYHFHCGHALYNREIFSLAIQYYSEAIRLDPNHADWFYFRGVALRHLKMDAKAQKDFDEARRLDSKAPK